MGGLVGRRWALSRNIRIAGGSLTHRIPHVFYRCPELPPDDIGGLGDGSDQAPPRPILARPKEIAKSDPIVGYGSSEAFELLVRRRALLTREPTNEVRG